jgi:hypothetical protein
MRLYKEDFTAKDRQLAAQKLAELLESDDWTPARVAAETAKKYNVMSRRAMGGIGQAVIALFKRWGDGTEAGFATKNYKDTWWSFMLLGYLLDRPAQEAVIEKEEPVQTEQVKPIEVQVPTYGDPFAEIDAANQKIISILTNLHIDLLRSFKDTVVPSRCTNAQFEKAIELSGMSQEFLEEIFN